MTESTVYLKWWKNILPTPHWNITLRYLRVTVLLRFPNDTNCISKWQQAVLEQCVIQGSHAKHDIILVACRLYLCQISSFFILYTQHEHLMYGPFIKMNSSDFPIICSTAPGIWQTSTQSVPTVRIPTLSYCYTQEGVLYRAVQCDWVTRAPCI